MRYLAIPLFAIALVGAVACTPEAKPNKRQVNVQDTAAAAENLAVFDEDPEPVKGKIRNQLFIMEQALLKAGTLELRQGGGFFPDLSAEVVLFDESPAGKTYTFPAEAAGLSPHLRLKRKLEGGSLPDTETLMSAYQLNLVFGESQALGVPFNIELNVDQHQTLVKGAGFATYGDIKVVKGKLDTRYQSLDTLKLLAQGYVARHHEGISVERDFGATLYTNGTGNPASAFVGLEGRHSDGQPALIKLQFLMEPAGWEITNELSSDQIHEAHPVVRSIDGNLRSVEGLKARHVAGERFEKELQGSSMMDVVRGTSVQCYLSEQADQASCRAAANLANGDCHRRFYLLTNDGHAWSHVRDLRATQKVDYSTGKVVDGKPPSDYTCSA